MKEFALEEPQIQNPPMGRALQPDENIVQSLNLKVFILAYDWTEAVGKTRIVLLSRVFFPHRAQDNFTFLHIQIFTLPRQTQHQDNNSKETHCAHFQVYVLFWDSAGIALHNL